VNFVQAEGLERAEETQRWLQAAAADEGRDVLPLKVLLESPFLEKQWLTQAAQGGAVLQVPSVPTQTQVWRLGNRSSQKFAAWCSMSWHSGNSEKLPGMACAPPVSPHSRLVGCSYHGRYTMPAAVVADVAGIAIDCTEPEGQTLREPVWAQLQGYEAC
jgi:hypothetical protein